VSFSAETDLSPIRNSALTKLWDTIKANKFGDVSVLLMAMEAGSPEGTAVAQALITAAQNAGPGTFEAGQWGRMAALRARLDGNHDMRAAALLTL
jgi:hypothetical protein